MNWKLIEQYNCNEKEQESDDRFRIGNGCISLYGQLDEVCQRMIPAHCLSGIFISGKGRWRTFLHTPNACYMSLFLDGEECSSNHRIPLRHERTLDYQHALLQRETEWETQRGNVTIRSERFVSMEHKYAICMEYRIVADFTGRICMKAGIDMSEAQTEQDDTVVKQREENPHGKSRDEATGSKVESDNRMEYECEQIRGFSNQYTMLKVSGVKEGGESQFCMLENVVFPYECEQWMEQRHHLFARNIEWEAQKDQEYVLTKYVTLLSEQDSGPYDMKSMELMEQLPQSGYEQEKRLHCRRWEDIWEEQSINWAAAEKLQMVSRVRDSVYVENSLGHGTENEHGQK